MKLIDKLNKHFKGNLKGKTIALWGSTVEAISDDIPKLDLIHLLSKSGCKVKVYNPITRDEFKNRYGNTITYCDEMYEAALESDALLIITRCKEIFVPSWAVLQKTMTQPVIFDGQNLYDGKEVEKNGFSYYNIG